MLEQLRHDSAVFAILRRRVEYEWMKKEEDAGN